VVRDKNYGALDELFAQGFADVKLAFSIEAGYRLVQ
jgi:hypothetical protein